ncbi:hypothetical protein DFJ58DRAFT_129255 [Suillus subalutaceus]|uniref:uncharacterized protein n=1 Tax=Suillus subalutaceus TaxID=48586 RepID=UPI001B863B5D|nr:uncharacterized protein DFJ58DRAFT_129255 [Suillus subalutaceus]KAG1867236.1 hypothetical protein DFJ58DRAFT_129255 [Suillus subalutaceus]
MYEHESHWFADAVRRSFIKLFSEDEQLYRNHSARSRYCGTTSGPSDQGVKAVCDAYQPEWQRMLETLEQAEAAEQRHEAERAKQWLAQGQAEFEVEIRSDSIKSTRFKLKLSNFVQTLQLRRAEPNRLIFAILIVTLSFPSIFHLSSMSLCFYYTLGLDMDIYPDDYVS